MHVELRKTDRSVPERSKDEDSFIHLLRYGGCAARLALGRLKQRVSRPRISLIKRKKAPRPKARLALWRGCVFSPPSAITMVGFERGIGLAVFPLFSFSFPFIPSFGERKKRWQFQSFWGLDQCQSVRHQKYVSMIHFQVFLPVKLLRNDLIS